MSYKIEKVVFELRRKGFNRDVKEFGRTDIFDILERCNILGRFTRKELMELENCILKLCIENESGFGYLDERELNNI